MNATPPVMPNHEFEVIQPVRQIRALIILGYLIFWGLVVSSGVFHRPLYLYVPDGPAELYWGNVLFYGTPILLISLVPVLTAWEAAETLLQRRFDKRQAEFDGYWLAESVRKAEAFLRSEQDRAEENRLQAEILSFKQKISDLAKRRQELSS